MLENNGQPKYKQLADQLRSRIAAGVLPVGEELPSTTKLAATYEVSTTVVRAAIRELQHEGLVIGQPGKAVYVYSMAVRGEAPTLEEMQREVAALRAAVRELQARVAALEEQ